LLVFKKNKKILSIAQRIRWFGIDRLKKQGGTWENDIKEIGYKYQMTDLGACLLLDSLLDFESILNHRKKIFNIYKKKLSNIKNLTILDTNNKKLTNSFWLCTILCNKRLYLQKKLRKFNIETNQVHFRNDRYKIFKKFIKGQKFPNMDLLEDNYLVIPLNLKITIKDAEFISKKIIEILR
jgi:perosamine synthetase